MKKATAEDINVHEDDATSVEQFDKLVIITKECHIAAPVCDHPSNEILTPIQDEVKSIMTDTPTQESVMFPDLVDSIHVQSTGEDQYPTKEDVQIILKNTPVLPQLHDSEMIT